MVKNKKAFISLIIVIIIMLIMMALLFILFKPSAAKYYDLESWDYDYNTSSFYVASNLLSDRSPNSFTINNYDFKEISFQMFNYVSDGQISINDITYDLSCGVSNSNYSCYIDNTLNGVSNVSLVKLVSCSNSSYTVENCESNGGTLVYSKNSNSHTFKVVRNNSTNINSLTLTITASVKSPFAKTISATINIEASELYNGVAIALVRSGDYRCDFLVTNYSDSTSVELNTTSSTTRFMENSSTSYTVDIGSYQSRKITVFKKISDRCVITSPSQVNISASSVSYNNSLTGINCSDLQCAIDFLGQLYGYSAAANISPDSISYNNSISGINCTNLQCALDYFYQITS